MCIITVSMILTLLCAVIYGICDFVQKTNRNREDEN